MEEERRIGWEIEREKDGRGWKRVLSNKGRRGIN